MLNRSIVRSVALVPVVQSCCSRNVKVFSGRPGSDTALPTRRSARAGSGVTSAPSCWNTMMSTPVSLRRLRRIVSSTGMSTTTA
jgi:hypothetical protein